MLYKAKYVGRDGFVADADSLMRELQRAEDAASNLDQNNIKDLGVIGSHAPAPSGSSLGTTFTHGSGLLITDPNAGTAEPMTTITTGTAKTVRGSWVPIHDGGGTNTPVALTFTLKSGMWMVLIGQVEWEVAGGTSATGFGIRLRLVVDGEPLDTFATSPAEQVSGTTTYWSGYVEQNVFLDPGDHRVEMQGADLRNNDAEIAGVHRRTIIGMGFAK